MSDGFYRAFEERYRGSREIIKARLAAYLPFVESLLKVYPAAAAIDLGCGRGEWLEVLDDLGFNTVGVDFDADMLEACHELGLKVEQGDAIAYLSTLSDESQVVVSAFHVVEHITFDQLRILTAEALRVLKPGGMLIMETPNPENIIVATRNFYLDPTHNRPIPPGLLSFVPEYYGFKRIKIVRLQESRELVESEVITLQDVLQGASPDYAVVAQKEAESSLMTSTSLAFEREYGLTLETLATRYDSLKYLNKEIVEERVKQAEERVKQAEERVKQAEAKALEQAALLNAVYSSTSWVLTRPLRGIKKWLIDDLSLFRTSLSSKITDLPLRRTTSTTTDRILFVDVSDIVFGDKRTGIQRVVRNILKFLLIDPPSGYVIKTVYALPKGTGYALANINFDGEKISLTTNEVPQVIEVDKGDVFLGLDFACVSVIQSAQYLRNLINYGVKVYFVLYDLLPVKMPTAFPNGVSDWHSKWLREVSNFSGIIAISEAVRDEYKEWLVQEELYKDEFSLDYFHMGANIEVLSPIIELPCDEQQVLKTISEKISFLMVGTIEPRKGYAQVFDAFELLWEKSFDVVLVIVGKRGWNTDELIAKINQHPKLNSSLFFIEKLDDAELDLIYKNSNCLMQASYGEGYGLPLIEAAQHQIPIIARDIKVFREVAKDFAFYFESKTPEGLSAEIISWLDLYEKNDHPKSINIPWLTWHESKNILIKKLIK